MIVRAKHILHFTFYNILQYLTIYILHRGRGICRVGCYRALVINCLFYLSVVTLFSFLDLYSIVVLPVVD